MAAVLRGSWEEGAPEKANTWVAVGSILICTAGTVLLLGIVLGKGGWLPNTVFPFSLWPGSS